MDGRNAASFAHYRCSMCQNNNKNFQSLARAKLLRREQKPKNIIAIIYHSTRPPSPSNTRKAFVEIAHKKEEEKNEHDGSLSRAPHVIKTEYIISSRLSHPTTMHITWRFQCHDVIDIGRALAFFSSRFLSPLLQFFLFCVFVFQVQRSRRMKFHRGKWNQKIEKKVRRLFVQNATAIIKENVHFLKP